MKKIFMFLCLAISFFGFRANIYAINYYSAVNFKTSFSEEINLEEINKIEIAYADQTEYTKYLMLLKDNNFESILTDVPVGDFSVEYGIVNDDTIGYYNVRADVYDNYDNTLDVVVNITLQNNPKNEDLTGDLKTEIVPSTNQIKPSNGTTTAVSDEEIDISDSTTTTSTTNKVDIKEEEEQQKREEEKRQNRKKSNIIGIMMFSTIGIVIIVAGIYAAIKISKANK